MSSLPYVINEFMTFFHDFSIYHALKDIHKCIDLVFLLADVIAICFCDCWYYHLIISCTKRCSTVVVVSLWQMLLTCGWCFYHCFIFFCFVGRCYCHVADVFTTILFFFLVLLADVITWWLMFLPLLCSFVFMADVVAWWLMECPPWVWMADVVAKVADGLATGSMF